MRTLSSVFLFLGLFGCVPVPPDIRPPLLVATEVSSDGKEVALTFDEPLARAETGVDASASRPAVPDGSKVKVELPKDLKPGAGHVWSAEVSDGSNVTTVAGKFYAANTHPAGLRLNEVRVAGSGAHTDMVELRVEAPGNLGGWTVEAWSAPASRQRLVLPDTEVAAGELIVIRYKAPQEKSDTAPGAREYWQPEAKGLSGTKGLVLIRQSPDGPGLDALLYCKNPGEARPIAEAARWSELTEWDPTPCTATRTWCRTEDAAWLVVATGGATPGAPNKLIPWEAQTSSRGAGSKTKGGTSRNPGASRSSGGRPSPWSKSSQEPGEGG